ncbi:glycosyltransferase [Riemerella anatipestifer]|uniref:glycosyltransferase n=1 Tax=Riemerella anatipestifer TaxID=34085 RepID=UPI000D697590|nr:glycosyltransferase [Riemerella anatipestifer]MDY3389961.1 glycosyltransferase [Riemerella anatipestifer]MDY3517943.1 glycosyltransferase [Riemerella anatipestifer]MDY3542929.1 glycosyltransferase [Riemerella anatipestifer]MRM84756.1 glycosyltransferase [Riemerella anatipestifer]WJR88255.1 hypothetical protein CCUG25010_00015 [Riemerella anatipestifer]
MKNNTIVYVGGFRFPDLDAAAKRVYGLGKVMNYLGYNVVFAGGESSTDTKERIFNGFSYYSMNELDKNNKNLFQKIISFFKAGSNTIEWLTKYITQNDVKKIIIYNSSAVFISKLIRFCKKNKIELLFDITEWYDSEHLPGGKYGIVALDNYIKMNYIYHKNVKKIVVSDFLKKHYETSSKTIVIPPINEYEQKFIAKGIEDKIRLLYAGSPGRKDDLYTIIKVYLENVDKLPNLEFNIVGIGEDFLSSQNLELGLGNIRFYGRLPFERVRLMYKNSHFSFLIRENKRYANAGFSTKFVESMSLSTPVIANLTSDIEKYLKNDINGVVINKLSEECILEVLIKINNMSLEQYENIQYEAYKTSQLFRGENFINNVKDILL